MYLYPTFELSSRCVNEVPCRVRRLLQFHSQDQRAASPLQHWDQVRFLRQFPVVSDSSNWIRTLYWGACSNTSNATLSPQSRSMHNAVVSPPIPPPQTATFKTISQMFLTQIQESKGDRRYRRFRKCLSALSGVDCQNIHRSAAFLVGYPREPNKLRGSRFQSEDRRVGPYCRRKCDH